MPSALPFLQLMLIAIGIVIAADQTCYGLNGTELDTTYGPCKPGARHSGCCAINRPAGSVDICLDNGLCMATDGQFMGTIWQDGCTDPTGEDPGCPRMCPDVRDSFDGLNKVLAWNIQMCDYGTYCCRAVNDHNNCCNNATAPIIKTNFLGAFQFETSTAGVASTSAPTSTPTSASAATETVFGTAITSGVPFQATSTSAPRPNAVCSKDKSAVVGGAVGGVLGAVIIALLGAMWWLYKRENRQRKLKEHYEEQFGQTWAYRRTVLVESDSREVRSELSIPIDEKQGVVSVPAFT
ncbi:hypothetical protein BDV96DRAFT_640886 [Lophiotrema nucula]|uniref:Mid2 domain-containing protein n=1 Tax=Lophiotrema nucula TaxID=690887 RepID=A0A6A5ZQG7_9PLEO|nr:hypothetical protein BDV96DRAFT_640886 [Lophiotrema nucula]